MKRGRRKIDTLPAPSIWHEVRVLCRRPTLRPPDVLAQKHAVVCELGSARLFELV